METERLGTCVLVLSPDKKSVLLGKRLNSYAAGSLGLPGGRVHAAEPLFECAKRELQEETGLNALSLNYVGVIREPQQDGNFVHFAFVCNEHSGTPMVLEPDKCEHWLWMPLRKLPESLLPGHAAAIELYINKNDDKLKDLT